MPANFKHHSSECPLASHLCREPFYLNFSRGHPFQCNIYYLNKEILYLTGRQQKYCIGVKSKGSRDSSWANYLAYLCLSGLTL